MAVFKRGGVWWYKFYFAGQFIRESSKSTSKTVAKDAENQRRRELEQGYHNLRQKREIRIRLLRDIADEYLADYKLRFRGVTFAEYAVGHVVRHLGDKLLVDIGEDEVLGYQTARLKESASAKSINEEVRFLLTMMGEPGEVIRVRLRKKKKLKLPVRRKIGKAYEPEETEKMGQLSRNSRSPHIHLALTMALNAGMRNAEIKSLTWSQIHLDKGTFRLEEAKRLQAKDGRFPSTRCSIRPSLNTAPGTRRSSRRFERSGMSFPSGDRGRGTHAPCDDPQDGMEKHSKECQRDRQVARPSPHADHATGRRRSWRGDDPADRRPRLQGGSQRLPPCTHEGEAGGA
jgi:integrase